MGLGGGGYGIWAVRTVIAEPAHPLDSERDDRNNDPDIQRVHDQHSPTP